MKLILHFLGALVCVALAAGCASVLPETASSSSGPVATCPVCQFNHDLACVCVKVKDGTPQAEFGGKTYYFCSDECRTAFLKKPEKYLSNR